MSTRVATRSALSVAGAVIGQPGLWLTAVRQIRVLARPRWWTAAPFLPVPSGEYLKFRLMTAYGGDGTSSPTADDVVAYLRWCRAYPLVGGR